MEPASYKLNVDDDDDEDDDDSSTIRISTIKSILIVILEMYMNDSKSNITKICS